MNTTAQILLIIMLLVLGSTLTVVGIQIFLILRDMREAVGKINLILEDTKNATRQLTQSARNLHQSLNSPWALIGGLTTLVKTFLSTKDKQTTA